MFLLIIPYSSTEIKMKGLEIGTILLKFDEN